MSVVLDEKGLAEFRASDAAIAKLQPYMDLRIDGINDKDGMKQVHAARMEVKSLRVAVEKSRKALKADALEFGKRVDAEANRIKALIDPIETHLLSEESVVEREKERIKAEAQVARLAKLQGRLDQLAAVEAWVTPAEVEAMTDDKFADVLKVKDHAFELKLKQRAEEADTARKERERLAAERAELEEQRRKQEQAEAEQRAQLQKEREHAEAEQRRTEEESRAKLKSEMLAVRKEREQVEAMRREQEAKERAEREAKEKAAAEVFRLAEEKRQREERDRVNAELKEPRAEVARWCKSCIERVPSMIEWPDSADKLTRDVVHAMEVIADVLGATE